MAMSDLIQSVKDGKVQTTSSSTTKQTKPGGELGKDAFMQLLVTQMQYQDPLNPSDNTQYISQLATFSQLEQMQNISQTTTNSQAFSLVGKNVIVKADSTSNSASNYITGKVDYVYVSGSSTKLSVDGKLYSFDQLDTVLADDYVSTQNNSTTGSTSNTSGNTATGSTSNTSGNTATESTSNTSGNSTTGSTSNNTSDNTTK
jgi:flagellar basal-body rod modification protein FlgD